LKYPCVVPTGLAFVPASITSDFIRGYHTVIPNGIYYVAPAIPAIDIRSFQDHYIPNLNLKP
jgi:hypothetical protein